MFEDAIRRKKHRIEEINRILEKIPSTGIVEIKGQPARVSLGSLRRLTEERSHFEKQISELETEERRLASLRAWEHLDHELVGKKVILFAGEMQKKIAVAVQQIHYDAAKRGNSAYFLPTFFRMQESCASEWARGIYRIYCGVLQLQGHFRTVAFASSVY